LFYAIPVLLALVALGQQLVNGTGTGFVQSVLNGRRPSSHRRDSVVGAAWPDPGRGRIASPPADVADLAGEAIRLADLPAARQRMIAVLGHDQAGTSPEVLGWVDSTVEIPMISTGQA
jgi:tRNA (guanosine-2'-O-)-methyltransferase